MNEMPTMVASSYSTSSLSGDDWLNKLNEFQAKPGQAVAGAVVNAMLARQPAEPKQFQPQAIKELSMSSARIVKVFIADPNDNLPLDKRVLHSGEEQLTDLTDQELFFDVPIADILAKHNDVRKVTVDKKQAEKFGRDIFLEPARIRDLKMVVVTVAQF